MDEKTIEIPDPPQEWSESTRALWRKVALARAKNSGRLELLRQALEARERAEKADALVEKEGMTFTTKTTGAVHVHPAVKVERESRALFARLWQALGMGYWYDE